jgi:superkiller protein 3
MGFDLTSPARSCFSAAYGLVQGGDMEAAIAMWRRGLEFTPDDVPHRIILGDQLSNMGRLEEALVEYEQALSVSPGVVSVLARIGETLYRRQEYARACRVLGEACERDPGDPALLKLLADATAAAGDADAARALWDRAVALAPQDAGTSVGRGQFLISRQQWDEARAELARAVGLSPGDYSAHYLLGVVQAQLDELSEAGQSLERALEIKPVSVEALHDLGVLRAMQGRLGEAEECFQRALAVDPDEQRCRRALEQLRSGAAGVTEPDAGPQ